MDAAAIGRAALKTAADQFADNVLPIIREIQKAGHGGANAIAGKLDERGVQLPTPEVASRKPDAFAWCGETRSRGAEMSNANCRLPANAETGGDTLRHRGESAHVLPIIELAIDVPSD